MRRIAHKSRSDELASKKHEGNQRVPEARPRELELCFHADALHTKYISNRPDHTCVIFSAFAETHIKVEVTNLPRRNTKETNECQKRVLGSSNSCFHADDLHTKYISNRPDHTRL